MSDAAGALSGTPRTRVRGMKLPLIDRIWRVRGEIPVDSSISPEEVFARLEPLLRNDRTALAVEGETLSYAKRNPAAQDKLATFNRGTFRIEPAGAGAVLRFDLFSNALLLCFLAPLLFLGFAQAAITLNAWEAAAEAAAKASEKSEKKDEEKPKPVSKLNPVDEFLGAPAPEDPNKKDKDEEDEGRHSPDEAYVLAGLFAVIYLVGRWLEPWLLLRRVRAALASPPIPG